MKLEPVRLPYKLVFIMVSLFLISGCAGSIIENLNRDLMKIKSEFSELSAVQNNALNVDSSMVLIGCHKDKDGNFVIENLLFTVDSPFGSATLNAKDYKVK